VSRPRCHLRTVAHHLDRFLQVVVKGPASTNPWYKLDRILDGNKISPVRSGTLIRTFRLRDTGSKLRESSFFAEVRGGYLGSLCSLMGAVSMVRHYGRDREKFTPFLHTSYLSKYTPPPLNRKSRSGARFRACSPTSQHPLVSKARIRCYQGGCQISTRLYQGSRSSLCPQA